jgi:hypothetical protein
LGTVNDFKTVQEVSKRKFPEAAYEPHANPLQQLIGSSFEAGVMTIVMTLPI